MFLFKIDGTKIRYKEIETSHEIYDCVTQTKDFHSITSLVKQCYLCRHQKVVWDHTADNVFSPILFHRGQRKKLRIALYGGYTADYRELYNKWGGSIRMITSERYLWDSYYNDLELFLGSQSLLDTIRQMSEDQLAYDQFEAYQ